MGTKDCGFDGCIVCGGRRPAVEENIELRGYDRSSKRDEIGTRFDGLENVGLMSDGLETVGLMG